MNNDVVGDRYELVSSPINKHITKTKSQITTSYTHIGSAENWITSPIWNYSETVESIYLKL